MFERNKEEFYAAFLNFELQNQYRIIRFQAYATPYNEGESIQGNIFING